LSIPTGSFQDAGILASFPQGASPALSSFQFYGAAYVAPTGTWQRLNRNLVSPNGTEYAYWVQDPQDQTLNEIHILDLQHGTDRTLYRSRLLYFPIAFEPDGIYLVHAINPRQGAFEKLYRLGLSSGQLQLVAGSDRHMYQWGWLLIADGAAWGIDNRVDGNTYYYSVRRLDLSTSQVTQWMEGPPNDMFWPLGVDGAHHVYVSDQTQLWRLDAPGITVPLADPGPIAPATGPGVDDGFASDSLGAWFSGNGGVWLYRDGKAPQEFTVGPQDANVSPAGLCT
jgi:hypothetical protein